MSFKMVIRSRTNPSGQEPLERTFSKTPISIGRIDTNDLQLRDERRLVSSRHAEVRHQGKNFVLIDLGSTNGTFLNKKRLQVGKEYSLAQGDEIRIGDFSLLFYSQLLPEKPAATPLAIPQSIVPKSNPMEQASNLLQELRTVCIANQYKGADERQALLIQTLGAALKGLEVDQAVQVVEQIQARLHVPMAQAAAKPAVVAPSPAVGSTCHDPGETAQVAYQLLDSIVRKYVKELEEPLAADTVRAVLDRLERIIEVTVNSLADAIKGRRQFEREFEVEATRLLSWKPNPIKLAHQGSDIGRYLLDPRRPDSSVDRIGSDLKDVFHDLALHQVGLIAGFKECLHALLEELDPEAIEAEARGTGRKVGPQLGSFLGGAVWRRYREKHKKLAEEEVRVFETILAPHFAKGYLSVQKSKTRSRS